MKTSATFRNAMEAVNHIGDHDPPWDAVLSSAKELVGADAATFIMLEGGTEKLGFVRQSGVDAAAELEYRQQFYQHDVIARACLESPAGLWWDSYELQRRPGGDRLPFFADFMHRHRTRQVACFIVLAEPDRHAGISFQRTTAQDGIIDVLSQGNVKAYTDALMNALSARASRIDTNITRIEAAFTGLGEAVFLASPAGKLVRCSATSFEMLKHAKMLSSIERALTHPRADVLRELLKALNKASTSATTVFFSAPTGWGTGLHFDIVPAPQEYKIASEALLLVRARQASAFVVPGVEELSSFFGLTTAEAKVLLGLIDGRPPKEIALASGVAERTVRNQIASLMQKMSCSRQSELVRLGSLLR
jgi:DNA-binding CsgD family transcriptional regulator